MSTCGHFRFSQTGSFESIVYGANGMWPTERDHCQRYSVQWVSSACWKHADHGAVPLCVRDVRQLAMNGRARQQPESHVTYAPSLWTRESTASQRATRITHTSLERFPAVSGVHLLLSASVSSPRYTVKPIYAVIELTLAFLLYTTICLLNVSREKRERTL